MPLTPEDVRNKQFTTVRLREGYDEDEVDAFLDEVETELTRLLRENEELRAKLAAATRAAAQNQQQQGMRKPEQQDGRGQGAPFPPPYPVRRRCSSSSRRWVRPSCPAARRSCLRVPVATARRAGPARPGPHGSGSDGSGPHGPGSDGPEPDGPERPDQLGQGPMGQTSSARAPWASRWAAPWGHGPQMGQQAQAPGGDSAARVLSLAQQTADQAIAEARSEANKIVGEARSRAEGLERDARAKADALERDAQEKHRVAMGSLESARATLERKVEDLRGFEREYRTRLKSYLESQLRQLETQADDSLAPPRTPATASLPPAPQMSGSMASGRCRFHGAPRWVASRPWAASSPCRAGRPTAVSSR